MSIVNISGTVSTAVIVLKSDIVTFTGPAIVTGSIRALNDALIVSVDATPSDNTFTVTIGAQVVSVAGDTDVGTTTAALVTALNASVLSNFAEVTWSDEGSGIIGAFVDAGGAPFSATLSVTGAGSGSVTDFTVEMTVLVASGVTISVTTGFIDFQGARGKYVHWQSNAAEPKEGDWQFITFIGSSTSNTLQWCIFSNASFGGLVFQGHAPGVDKFNYIILNNITTNFCFITTATGTVFIQDIAAVSAVSASHTGASVVTANRITIINPQSGNSFFNVSENGTWSDIFISDVSSGSNWGPASGKTINLNRIFARVAGNFEIGGSGGTVNLNDSVMQGTASGNIMLFASNSGTITATNCDFVNASGSNQGVFKSTGILNLVSCFIAGTFGFDISIVDISTATTDKQHSGVDTITTPRSTRNEIPDYSGISESGATTDRLIVTFTPLATCKSKIEYTTISNDYSANDGNGYDAPDVFIPQIGISLPPVVTDWGEEGAVYSKAEKVLTLKLPGDTYFYRIVSEDTMGNVFTSAQQGPIVVESGTDVTDPTWDDGGPGTDSGLVATDATTNGEVNLSWNTPLDAVAVEGVQLFFSTVSAAQAITDGVKRIIPANITSIRLGGLTNDTEHFFIVRALDKAENTTSETSGITATPTAVGTPSPVPGALQSFLTAE